MNYEINGFNVAAAFTAYDNESENILDPSYGELVFNHYWWGSEGGSFESGRRRVES